MWAATTQPIEIPSKGEKDRSSGRPSPTSSKAVEPGQPKVNPPHARADVQQKREHAQAAQTEKQLAQPHPVSINGRPAHAGPPVKYRRQRRIICLSVASMMTAFMRR